MSEKIITRYPTLVSMLRRQMDARPDATAYTFLTDGEAEEENISFAKLDRRARMIAARLQQEYQAGERALLLYPAGIEYLAAFFGCLYAGVVAVPAYPPRLNRPSPRIQAITADAGASLVLTTTTILENIKRRLNHTPELAALRWLETTKLPSGLEDDWQEPDIRPQTLAYLQYTSGSTSTPKGVMLSHSNLMHNLARICHSFQIERILEGDPQGTGVFWLPIYHDMGLIGGMLQPMYVNRTSVFMSPESFLQRPVRWLQAISRHKGRISGAPNFAYQYCVDKIKPKQLEGLDLSQWKLAFCGAEPVQVKTLRQFADKFSPYGFTDNAFYPCYGLAEATLLASGGLGPGRPSILSVNRNNLSQGQVVTVKTPDFWQTDPQDIPDDPARLDTVSCGQTMLNQEIAIVEPESGRRCLPGQVGEIWIAGPSVAGGYWKRPKETRVTFGRRLDGSDQPFMRTGDLGFMKDGQLYITGRLKDLIIIRGRNHYPQDIEQTVEASHPALAPHLGASFSIERDGEERLVVVQELKRSHRKADVVEVAAAVRQAVADNHQLQTYAIVLVKPLSVPKTSSGKVKRYACRQGFLEGTLDVVGEWRATTQEQSDSEVAQPETQDGEDVSSRTTADIQQWLVSHMAAVLKIRPEQIDIHQPFSHYGLDSAQAVSLSGELEQWLSVSLSPTLVWDYPTISELSAHLATNGLPVNGNAKRQDSPQPHIIRSSYRSSPIAIIGLGCRFPGAPDPDGFWQLLQNGVDAITEVPPDRWHADEFYSHEPAVSGKMNTRWGGFLENVDQFDPYFFGISPREAARIDPQQRLALEVAWEALEHAGQAPGHLAKSLTGVFLGISSYDYSRLQFSHPGYIDAYAGTGNAHSVAANRISYLLDLRGPSMAIDTACSSSLVAVHQAAQNLHGGDCDLALAGGVNVILQPDLTIFFSQARAMAADGRCKAFDQRADGYVRSEGCGFIVMKRLDDAIRDGDNVLAVLYGQAVNQDGRSNGLTAPNGPAQQAVIRRALQKAGFEANDISFIEAHGTGTPLGDPIEVQALRAVLEEKRPASRPYYVGSVKTNVGHMEAAAGIGGLIKTILALQNDTIPAHLHLQKLNSHIDLDGSPLEIPTAPIPWPRGTKPRLAGVSSFGFGGTNAHLIVGDPPYRQTLATGGESHHDQSWNIVPLSGRSPKALHGIVKRYSTANISSTPLPDIAYTAAIGRDHHSYRQAIIAQTPEQLQQKLAGLAGKERMDVVKSGRPRIAFLFTGAGSQYAGMGQGLYDNIPVFRETIDYCETRLQSYLDVPLRAILFPDRFADGNAANTADINKLTYTQPALFALEYALATLWQSWGIEPNFVMGHSTGEYVAACVAGAFSLEDGLKIIATRGRLMDELPQAGSMASIFANVEQVDTLVAAYKDHLAVAVINGPENVVISGATSAVDAVMSECKRAGIAARKLPISQAAHSPLIRPILDPFNKLVETAEFYPPKIPLVTNVSGRLLYNETPGPAHWRQHLLRPVQFSAGMQTLAAEGATIYLEIGPQPGLLALGRRCIKPDRSTRWLPSLRKNRDDMQVILDSLGRLYEAGAEVDWDGFYAAEKRRKVILPTTPFERERFWFDLPDGQPLPAPTIPIPSNDQPPRREETPAPPPEPKLPPILALEDPEARRPLLTAYLQETIAAILDLDPGRLGLDQPLDTVGLDSLMAIEVKSRLEAEIQVSLPIVRFLEGPTIKRLAEQLEDRLDKAGEMERPITPAPIPPDQPHPLSYNQQALWFLHELLPDGVSFNVAGAVRLRGEVDAEALEAAFGELYARHAALRLTFRNEQGQPVQQVGGDGSVPFVRVDATAWDEKTLLDYLVGEAYRPFDLASGPIIRLVLLQRPSGEYVLLLSMDHIISDLWSISVMVQDLYQLYRAKTGGEKVLLPSLSLHHTDYVHWETELVNSDAGRRMREYWLQQLSGDLPMLHLPTDRPRPAEQTYAGDMVNLSLDEALVEKLGQLGRKNGATLYMVFLAAFQTLLHRYTGQEDLLTGTVLAGRSRPEVAGLVGYFINPIAMRADFSDRPTFASFLQQVRRNVLDAVENQYYPLPLLADELDFHRDPSRPPLFETMFIMQKAQVLDGQPLSALAPGMPDAELNLSGLTLKSIPLPKMPAQFDLTLMAAETGTGMALALHFNTGLFDAATMEHMLAHFEQLLLAAAENPEQRVAAMPLLTRGEREQVLTTWNNTAADYPTDQCLHQLVEAQSARTPARIAIVGEQPLTYFELNEQAGQLACRLRSFGIGPETLVGVALGRSPQMLVALLAVLKAGGAYVPLDPAFPQERLALMLEDAVPPLLLTDETNLDAFSTFNVPVILCEKDGRWQIFRNEAREPSVEKTLPGPSPDNLAYVIYTSGSTGRPKGVQISHRAVVNFLSTMAEQPGLSPDDALLAVTTLSFDIAVLELFLPLTVGAKVVIAPAEKSADGVKLAELIEKSAATMMQATPATWQMLLDAGWRGSHHLRKILCGGEALPPALAGDLLAFDIELWNMYGPTETTIWSSIAPITATETPVTVGRPIANTHIYILNKQLQPLPIGVPGDLYIGGDGLARGYLNRPKMTAERFIPSPFTPGDRLYRTGDRAAYRPDGAIRFLGRDDRQVKVRGYRIELGEVEAALAQHPFGQPNAVVLREDEPGDKRLVAYLIGDDKPPAGELRDFLHRRLPDYMIPAHFIALDALPLTPNGKVNRRLLPAPNGERPQLLSDYVPPRNKLEQELAQLLAGLFGLEQVGIHDNFFELGGNSLQATRLLFQVNERLDVQIPLRHLFTEPTVAGLSEAVAIARGQKPESPLHTANGRKSLFGKMTLDDLKRDAKLAEEITPAGLPTANVLAPKNILLTGATGFLGAFLLHRLLRQTDAAIKCLVRANDESDAIVRLRKNLNRYNLWDEDLAARIVAIPGDLTHKRLGLSEKGYDRLAASIDIIYHNGAMVNFVYPYQAHKGANIVGTNEILRLATTKKLKAVHLVSTLSVLHTGDHDDGTVHDENVDLEENGVPFGGYAQSKWVAEKLALAAGERGVPIAIYRPGLISGDSNSGITNTADLIFNLSRACLLLGAAPDLEAMVDVVPVDYVSEAIIHLSLQQSSFGKTFHLANTQRWNYRQMVAWLQEEGFPLEMLPYETWRDRLIALARQLDAGEWAPFLPLLEEANADQIYMPDFDCQNVLDGLAETEIDCPPVGPELFGRYLRFFASQSFMLDGAIG